ncbi:DUF6978 family protein [Amycolatopsis minnesotensis]|uniref:Uncharacterized protein n=1 Tax=Amycolatopsis minnesotensis TaxID=337894 RepID=A0ABN2S5K5_9PSEU
MLEQWHADQLLRARKVYSRSLRVDLEQGADHDYAVESDDGNDHFLLDVRRSLRNPLKARFQLRYRRDIVLARLCTSVPHGNPDGTVIGFPHLHKYREGDLDKWAETVDNFADPAEALNFFCREINLPEPELQGGLT